MTPTDALLLLQEFAHAGYKSRALETVLFRARKVIADEAARRLQDFVGELCATCWGDGWNRLSPTILRGPCETCNGTGRRPEPPSEVRAQRGETIPAGAQIDTPESTGSATPTKGE